MHRVFILLTVALSMTLAGHAPQSYGQTSAGIPEVKSDLIASCAVQWNNPSVFGNGGSPAVAVNGPSNLFIETNAQRTAKSYELVYRLGLAADWSPRSDFGSPVAFGDGSAPGVSMNTDGVLIEVHQNPNTQGGLVTDVYYRIGKLDLGAGIGQKVVWSSPVYSYDGGIAPQVAINDRYQVVEVHETNNIFNHKLYYHTGFIHQTGDKYYILWTSGGAGFVGTEYDSGRSPHIALDNDGNVVEVHQAAASNNLHYRRGRLTNSRIAWVPGGWQWSNGDFVNISADGSRAVAVFLGCSWHESEIQHRQGELSLASRFWCFCKRQNDPDGKS